MPDKDPESHAEKLSGGEWLICLGAMALLALALPRLWEGAESWTWGPDSRLPQSLSEDYRLFSRACEMAARDKKTALLGDSVIWGEYVEAKETLAQDLNILMGENRFANLGLDGAHPAALAGLFHVHGSALRGLKVLLHLDPLWMSSPQRDLGAEETQTFNHPRLVPQFWPRIPCYREVVSRKIGIVMERSSALSGWVRHIQLSCFDKMDIPAWSLDHPYENPLGRLKALGNLDTATSEKETLPWTQRGIEVQNFPWLDLDSSIQWSFFRGALEELLARGNCVFVLLGPFNESMLTAQSLERYRKVKTGMEGWLKKKGLPFLSPPALESSLYADASHPLAEGYARIAKSLAEQPFF